MARVSMSNQRTVSLGKPTVVRAGAATPTSPRSDTRSRTPGQGGRGTTTCTACLAVVSIKASQFADREAGIRIGDSLLSPHRVGGGRYSVHRGDARCPGSDRPAGPATDPQPATAGL